MLPPPQAPVPPVPLTDEHRNFSTVNEEEEEEEEEDEKEKAMKEEDEDGRTRPRSQKEQQDREEDKIRKHPKPPPPMVRQDQVRDCMENFPYFKIALRNSVQIFCRRRTSKSGYSGGRRWRTCSIGIKIV